jgi:LytR cell envelope-related transcriptional attenuator
MLAVVAVVLILSLSGGSHKNPSASTPTSATNTGASSKHTSVTHAAAQVTPGAISVSVLNGTEINGLAHRIAASLQEKGYKRATALDGHPPGAYPKTIVEYESGHSADARSIAQALDISASEVQPMQAAMLPLISGATVAIVAGEDQPTPASGPTETPGTQNSGASESSESGAGATG